MTVDSIPSLLSEEFSRDPYVQYRRMREMDHIHQDRDTGWYLISRSDECREAFRSEDVFTSENYVWGLEPVHGRTILQMSGAEHASKRALLNPFFRGAGLEKWAPAIRQAAEAVLASASRRAAGERLETIEGAASIDLVADFSHYYPIDVIAEMLDLPTEKHDDFQRWYTSILRFLSNFAEDEEVYAEGIRTQEEIRGYLLPLVRQRRAAPGDDLISKLCEAQVKGEQMSDEEIKAFVSLLLTAGGETTDKSISSMFKNLLEHHEVFEALLDDWDLLPAVVVETLRFSPPTHMTMRQLGQPTVVRDTELPKGAKVLLLNASANRDESVFSDPDRFDISRSELEPERGFSAAATHLAFGGGRHFCVGSMLAKVEMETAADVVLNRFPRMRLAPGATTREVGIKTRGPQSLRVVLMA